MYSPSVPEIDNHDLRSTLRSIHAGALTADEAKGILDITRRAAAADQRTDIAEMTMLLRIKDYLAQLADEVSLPITGLASQVPTSSLSPGARELAFACAYLVIDQDLSVGEEERAMSTRLASELGLDEARTQDLIAMIDRLVRSA